MRSPPSAVGCEHSWLDVPHGFEEAHCHGLGGDDLFGFEPADLGRCHPGRCGELVLRPAPFRAADADQPHHVLGVVRVLRAGRGWEPSVHVGTVSGDVTRVPSALVEVTVSEYEIRALSAETWDAFAELVGRHNGGGFGGCWCTWFHRATHSAPGTGDSKPASYSRDFKRELVETGHAHAALVFDGEAAVGWAQFGSPAELPGIAHRKEVETADSELPDWRITCVFVDRRYRRRGVARVAVDGALALIARAGGGVVETYPQDTAGKKVSASFLYNATRSTFEDAGFSYQRPKGKNHCIMRITVPG